MRKRVVAANWKMNLTAKEGAELIKKLKPSIDVNSNEIVICPPFVDLYAVGNEIKSTNIKLGAQNFYYEDKGAFTGEVSISMLKEAGVEYVIIGHSERRQIFKENDELINKKVLKAIFEKVIPILCCGENLEQREKGETLPFIQSQIENAFFNVEIADPTKVIIAYEPIWAIGTGKTATADQAEEVCAFIRSVIEKLYCNDIASQMRILYGGSVKGSNAKEIFEKENIDGGLIGGASLNDEFIDIVKV